MALEFSGKQDVYIEIAERYKAYIKRGIYKNGEKLPSVRTVAGEIRVNPNTVQRAYSLLEEWGYIKSLNKKGAFVIYTGDRVNKSNFVFDAIVQLKNDGATYDEILTALKEAYKND